MGVVSEKIKFETSGVSSLNSAADSLGNIQSGLTQIGTALTAFSAASAVALGKAAGDWAKYELKLKNVTSLFRGDTTKQFDFFKSKLMELPPVYGDVVENTEALYQAISGGVTEPAQAMNFLKRSVEAANVGLGSTFQAVDAGTTIMNTFKVSADNANEIFDSIQATIQTGKITMEQYGSSVSRVASTASAAGVSYKELNGLIATFTKNGISAAESMTSINALFQAFIKPSDGAKKALAGFKEEAAAAGKTIDFDLSASFLKENGVVASMEKMMEATGGNIESLAKILPNVRALKGASLFAKGGLEDLTSAMEAQNTSSGLVSEKFADLARSMSSSMSDLWTEVKKTFIALGEGVTFYLKPVIDALVVMATGIKNLVMAYPRLTAGVAIFVTGLTGLIGALSLAGAAIAAVIASKAALIAGFTVLGTAISAIMTLFSAVLVPIGLVAAAFAGLYLLVKNFGAIWDWVKEKVVAALNGVHKLFTSVLGGMKDLLKSFGTFFSVVWDSVTEYSGYAMNIIKTAFGDEIELLKEIFRSFGVFADDVWNWIKEKVVNVLNDIHKLFASIYSGMKDLLKSFGLFFSVVWDSVAEYAGYAMDVIKNTFGDEIESLKEIFRSFGVFVGGVWDYIKEMAFWVFGAVNDFIKEKFGIDFKAIFTGIYDFLSGVVSGMKDAFINGFSAVSNYLSTKFDPEGKGIFEGMKNFIIKAYETVRDAIIAAFKAIVDYIKTTFIKISDVISAPFETAFNKIKGYINSSRDALNDFIDTAKAAAGISLTEDIRGERMTQPQNFSNSAQKAVSGFSSLPPTGYNFASSSGSAQMSELQKAALRAGYEISTKGRTEINVAIPGATYQTGGIGI